MKIYKTKVFARLARKEGVSDKALCKAVAEMNDGLVHAELGGGLVKQRVARDGGGKRGGWRTVLAFRPGRKAFFLHVFPKSAKDNLDDEEKTALKAVGKRLLSLKGVALERALAGHEIMEVICDDSQSQESDP